MSARVLRRGVAGLLFGLLVFAPLTIGTVHDWSRAVVACAAILALALTLVERMRRKAPFPVTVPLVGLGVVLAATALQLVPLPAAVLATISPAAHELLDGVQHHSIALDGSAAWRSLVQTGSYLGFYAAACVYASRPSRRALLAGAIVVVATVLAVIGLVETALGRGQILFVYTPVQDWWQPRVVRGSFVNPNHFGALLCLAAPAALVMGLRAERPRLRAAAYAATFVLNLAAMLTFTRATIVAIVIGQALALLFLRTGERRERRPLAWLGIAAIVAAGLGAGVYLGVQRLGREAQHTLTFAEAGQPDSKLQLWRDTLEMSFQYPWTGVGRGSFEQAFTRYSTMAGQLRHEYAENGYLQAAADLGWPIALLLAALAVAGLRLMIARVGEEPVLAGSLAAIIALAVHEVGDFAIELPGVALAALAHLAILFGRPSAETHAGRRRIAVRAPFLVLPVLLAACVVVDLARPSAAESAAEVSRLARDPAVPVARVLARAEELHSLHPADYFLPAVTAERLFRDRHPAVLRWLNRAMYLNPRQPALHLIAAEYLAGARQKSQALLEYRLAAERARDPRAQVWERVLVRYPALADLLAATPDQPRHLGLLAKWLRGKGRAADADEVYRRALARAPEDAALLAQWTRLAIERGDAPAARERVERLRAVDRSVATRQLEIQILVLAGELEAAGAAADKIRARDQAGFETELGLASAWLARNDLARARKRLDALSGWRLDRPARARLHEVRAALEKAAGNPHQERWELEERARLLAQ